MLFRSKRTGSYEQFESEVRSFVEWVKQSPPSHDDSIMIAGEPELQIQEERQRTGIPVEDKTWLDISNVAKQFGVQLQ